MFALKSSLALLTIAALTLVPRSFCQADHSGSIHTDPSTSGEGVRFSPTPPKKAKNSDEVASSLLQALAVNGVNAPNATPWHALLTYDVFDEDGDNSHSGSIEVFSLNDKKYRRVFQSDTRTQESRPLTEVATGSQLYHVGDQTMPDAMELQVIREALGPWDEAGVVSPSAMTDKIEWKVGKTKLSCIIIRRRDATVSDNGLPKFCFDPGTQVLRYTRGSGWDETVYNNIIQFQNRSVANDIEVTHSGKPINHSSGEARIAGSSGRFAFFASTRQPGTD